LVYCLDLAFLHLSKYFGNFAGFYRCDKKKSHRKQHVLLVLVDGAGVWDGVRVFDHADGLAYGRHTGVR